ncbi:MAG TPA: SMP-30/gluconolactonase/LRE family protein [Polyangiaceae bacterium]|nr:SMP-30/gluconolactonase/LRE family protein [Polyangiaceae bacterium]
MRVQQLDVPVCTLGEGPVWSDRDGCLYYLDIVAHRLQAYTPTTKQHRAWIFDTFVGSLAECRSGGLILSLGDRIVRFDPRKDGTSVEELVVLERDRPLNRLNDGKADPWGRFWVGSMRIAEDAREGRLWCVTADGKAEAVRDGIGVSNSSAFDRARNRMYFADSMTGMIEQATFDDAHQLGSFQPFAKAGVGAPDGSCTDAAGYLWNAEWGGQRLCRYAPDGSLERVLDMPVTRPSCPTFGGERHRTLFITSARLNMTPEELARDPQAGGLFAVELDDVEGLPADQFAI